MTVPSTLARRFRWLLTVVGIISLVTFSRPLPASSQQSIFTQTTAFAAKTGFRGVFAWSATQPVLGLVHFGTSPGNLDRTASALPNEADTAQMAVAQLTTGTTYYYQVEDVLTGERSAIESFTATNAYNAWNGSTYTIDLLVQLDTESLPPDIPADQALSDIAAGINVFAERLYDALDGYARLGKVLITDTNLDYAANMPFYAPACDNERSNLADVLVQTSVPFDSHTFGGWSIDKPCISFYVGRIGQLVVPWENDLHFGYVATHEMIHYAFNAPDLYPLNSDADCRNLDWDGSLMHNTGGFDGRWFLTELDRNPTLTPCAHGSQPWTWDVLRTRYANVPLNPEGPIDHMIDEQPRGNPDGGALEIMVLDRTPASSTLTPYTPDDGVPPACSNTLPQVQDAEGDANGFVVIENTPSPNEPSLDITHGRLTWDADAEAVTFHIKVKDLTELPPTGGDGHFFRFYFAYGGQQFQLRARRDSLAESRTLARPDNTILARDLPGSFNSDTDEITIVVSNSVLSGISPAPLPLAEGSLLEGFEILAQRLVGVLTLTADTGRGSCSYRVGQENLAPNDPPLAVADAASTMEDTSVTVDVLANDSDPEGDAISVSAVSVAGQGSPRVNSDGSVTYTPAPDKFGVDSFSYTIRDSHGGSATAQVSVEIAPVNDAPVAANDAGVAASGAPVTIAVRSNDSDIEGDMLGVSAVTQGSWGAVTTNGSEVTYTPGGGFADADSFTYTLSDGNGGTADATVLIQRAECLDFFVDDLEPSPQPGWTFNSQKQLATTQTWAHTADPFASSVTHSFFSDASDASPNKDDRLLAPPQQASAETELRFWHRFRTEEGFDGGVLEVSTDGGATFQDVLDAGGVFLQGGYSGLANAINSGDPAWTGASQSATAMEEVVVDLGALAGQEVIVRWRLVTDSNLGDAGWWIDDVRFNGVVGDACPPALNRLPVAVDDESVTQQNTPVSINVLDNDSDPDGDALSVESVTQAEHGEVSHNGSSVSYTPETGFIGSDVFHYTISDGFGGSDVAQVQVHVNGAPVAVDDEAATAEDQAATIDVLGNDSDPNGDELAVSSVGPAGHGSVSVNADGSISYEPQADYHGSDSFTYTISDGHGASATALVSVVVTSVNDQPEAVADTAATEENRPVIVAVLLNDKDVDGDTLTVVSATRSAAGGSVRIRHDGSVQYRPPPGFSGSDSFAYTISDGQGGLATASVSVTVAPK